MSIGETPDADKSAAKKAATTMTFRIDKDIIRLIKEKAEQDGITLNTLVNRILKRYSEWDMYIENRAGIIPLTRPVAFELFKRLSKEEVINLALEVGIKAVYDITLFMRGGINRDSFIDWFLSRMRNSSASVVSKNVSSGLKAYVVKHDMGENWSLYHKTIMEAIFSDILREPIQVNMTESTLTLEFEEGQKKSYLEV